MKQETETETAPQLAHVKHESIVPVNSADTDARKDEHGEENTTADSQTPVSSAMTQRENPEISENKGEEETVDGGDDGDSSQRMEDEREQQSTARPVTRSRSPRKQTQGDTEPTATAGPKASRFVWKYIECMVHNVSHTEVPIAREDQSFTW